MNPEPPTWSDAEIFAFRIRIQEKNLALFFQEHPECATRVNVLFTSTEFYPVEQIQPSIYYVSPLTYACRHHPEDREYAKMVMRELVELRHASIQYPESRNIPPADPDDYWVRIVSPMEAAIRYANDGLSLAFIDRGMRLSTIQILRRIDSAENFHPDCVHLYTWLEHVFTHHKQSIDATPDHPLRGWIFYILMSTPLSRKSDFILLANQLGMTSDFAETFTLVPTHPPITLIGALIYRLLLMDPEIDFSETYEGDFLAVYQLYLHPKTNLSVRLNGRTIVECLYELFSRFNISINVYGRVFFSYYRIAFSAANALAVWQRERDYFTARQTTSEMISTRVVPRVAVNTVAPLRSTDRDLHRYMSNFITPNVTFPIQQAQKQSERERHEKVFLYEIVHLRWLEIAHANAPELPLQDDQGMEVEEEEEEEEGEWWNQEEEEEEEEE